MRRAAGQITVFLALSSVLIFALILNCLEASRSACIEAILRQGADSAVRSVFAAYQGEVRREYGLLLCQGKDTGELSWPEEAQKYAEKYLQPGAGTLFDASDRIRAVSVSVSALDSVFITEGQGRIFADEVADYMSSAGLSILLQELLGRLGLYSEEDGFGLIDSLKGMLGEGNGIDDVLGNYKDIKNQAGELQKQAKEKPGSTAPSPAPAVSAQEMKTDLLEQIKAIKNNGLIAVITGSESLSEYPWQDWTLPSRLNIDAKNLHKDFPSPDISLLKHFLMGEFLFRRMGSYTDPKENGSRYEAEYILSGKSSDKEAFESVVGELILIRTGLNLAYLACDGEKLARAEALAAAIMSLLALPQLILVLKWLLVAAWAAAESIVDLRMLIKGKKVPLFKSSDSWNLAALSLDLSAEGDGRRGLGYEDYLRLLFYIGRGEDQAYRMMDVIQKRIQQKKPLFRMSEYMVYAAADVQVSAPYLYIQNRTAPLLGGSAGGRKYRKTAVYGYGRR